MNWKTKKNIQALLKSWTVINTDKNSITFETDQYLLDINHIGKSFSYNIMLFDYKKSNVIKECKAPSNKSLLSMLNHIIKEV